MFEYNLLRTYFFTKEVIQMNQKPPDTQLGSYISKKQYKKKIHLDLKAKKAIQRSSIGERAKRANL